MYIIARSTGEEIGASSFPAGSNKETMQINNGGNSFEELSENNSTKDISEVSEEVSGEFIIDEPSKDGNKELSEVVPDMASNDSAFLRIKPIAGNRHEVSPIDSLSVTIPDSDIVKIIGEIREENQKNDYPFQAVVGGTYRFEFSDVPDGTDFSMELYNSGWEIIDSSYNLDNRDGLTASLKEGESYYLRILQYNKVGTYMLNIGSQKPIADISSFTEISDSIQYKNQKNNYLFIPKVTGRYRFQFSDVPDGTDLGMELYNSGWEIIDSTYNLDNGDGLTVLLTEGKSYYVRVVQYNNVGAYMLNIGNQKPIVNISSYTEISDSIQYKDQENIYLFIPNIDGRYGFEFSDISEGTALSINLYNSGWELIDSNYNISNGEGMVNSLNEGGNYYVVVLQCNNKGEYTLNINQNVY